jgi:hypothetical protein
VYVRQIVLIGSMLVSGISWAQEADILRVQARMHSSLEQAGCISYDAKRTTVFPDGRVQPSLAGHFVIDRVNGRVASEFTDASVGSVFKHRFNGTDVFKCETEEKGLIENTDRHLSNSIAFVNVGVAFGDYLTFYLTRSTYVPFAKIVEEANGKIEINGSKATVKMDSRKLGATNFYEVEVELNPECDYLPKKIDVFFVNGDKGGNRSVAASIAIEAYYQVEGKVWVPTRFTEKQSGFINLTEIDPLSVVLSRSKSKEEFEFKTNENWIDLRTKKFDVLSGRVSKESRAMPWLTRNTILCILAGVTLIAIILVVVRLKNTP